VYRSIFRFYLCERQKNRKSISDYCTYVRENLVTWKRKKHNAFSWSSSETEDRGGMAHTTCEMM